MGNADIYHICFLPLLLDSQHLMLGEDYTSVIILSHSAGGLWVMLIFTTYVSYLFC